MTDQELLQAIRTITREEIQASEGRMRTEIQDSEGRMMTEIQASEGRMRAEIQASEDRMRAEILESEKRVKKDVVLLMDAEFGPKFDLLADEISIVREKLGNLEKKVDRIEDKVLEHEFRLQLIR